MVSSKGKGVIFSPTLLILIRKQTIELLEAARHKLVLQSVLRLVCSRTTTIATFAVSSCTTRESEIDGVTHAIIAHKQGKIGLILNKS